MSTEETTLEMVGEFITALGIVTFPFVLWILLCS